MKQRWINLAWCVLFLAIIAALGTAIAVFLLKALELR